MPGFPKLCAKKVLKMLIQQLYLAFQVEDITHKRLTRSLVDNENQTWRALLLWSYFVVESLNQIKTFNLRCFIEFNKCIDIPFIIILVLKISSL